MQSHAALRGFDGELAADAGNVDVVGVHFDVPARTCEIKVAVSDGHFVDGDVPRGSDAHIVRDLRGLAPEVELFGGEATLRGDFRRAADPDAAGDDIALRVDGGLMLALEVVHVDIATGKDGKVSGRLNARLTAQEDVAASQQGNGRNGGEAVFHSEDAARGEAQVARDDAIERDAGDAQVAAGPRRRRTRSGWRGRRCRWSYRR